MTNSTNRVEIITSVQRRRRWTAPEKVRMVEETFEPGMTVSLVVRRHGVAPNQLFTWRRLVAQGSLTGAGSGEEVVPASDYRTLLNQVRELHRLLGTALILDTSSSSGSGGRPIRFLDRSCRRSARLERETPMTSATVFIGNRPSAATAAAAVVFFDPVA